ncbi:hypothetical protein BTHERMOSOX_1012 [Bathymodiolus thermophilus thioautotrophic gill symbiont]|nr:hypothetical protein BTHERMOSOX_1012 [Bathymodiolus thermophilus thioautotrophic gill symbiont]
MRLLEDWQNLIFARLKVLLFLKIKKSPLLRAFLIIDK